jgi:hypothetical protein
VGLQGVDPSSQAIISKPIKVTIIDPGLLTLFTIRAQPNILEVAQGGLTTFTVFTDKTQGNPSDITLSIENAPSGMVASFSRNPVKGGDLSGVRLVVASGVPEDVYNLKVKGVSGGITFRTDLKVTVHSASDATFDLTVTNSSLTLIRGITPFFSPVVQHTRLFGFSAPVTLSLENIPDGVTATLTKTTLLSPNDSAVVKLEAGARGNPWHVLSHRQRRGWRAGQDRTYHPRDCRERRPTRRVFLAMPQR